MADTKSESKHAIYHPPSSASCPLAVGGGWKEDFVNNPTQA